MPANTAATPAGAGEMHPRVQMVDREAVAVCRAAGRLAQIAPEHAAAIYEAASTIAGVVLAVADAVETDGPAAR